MNGDTKIIIGNNGRGYLGGTFGQFCDNPPGFSQIGWKGNLPRGYEEDTDLWNLIIEKVIRPECFISYEGDFKCYGVDNYSYKINNLSGYDWSLEDGVLEFSKPVELITNRLRVLVEEQKEVMKEPNIKIIINTIEINKTFPEEIETTNTDYFNFRIESQEELDYLNNKIYEFIREDFNQKMYEIGKEIERARKIQREGWTE